MKQIIFFIFLIIVTVALFESSGVFVVLTQPYLGLKQWIFILITLTSFLILILLHITKNSRYGIYLFFLVYPFLTQSTYYLNISASFFILTPAFLYLIVHLFFLRSYGSPVANRILFLFACSTIISVSLAENTHTAYSFFFLGIGSFVVSLYVFSLSVTTSTQPLEYIRNLILSLMVGSTLYFLIETISFGLRPVDIFHIVARNFRAVSGYYYTGGFREPAGLGFVCAILFWIIFFFVQQRLPISSKLNIWIDRTALFLVGFFIIIVGTRSALLNILNILFVILFLQKVLKIEPVIKIKRIHLVALGIILSIGAFLLIPRTFRTDRSRATAPWIQPTYVTVGNYSFEIVGTTPYYFQRSFTTLNDFFESPLGTGPYNGSLTEYERIRNKTGPINHYFLLTNLVVTGATFGWFSLLIWLIFVGYVARYVVKLRNHSQNQMLLMLTVVFLSIFLASFLPGSYYLGPHINWANFNRMLPISVSTPGVPAEYPAIISGLVIGILTGLMRHPAHKVELQEERGKELDVNSVSYITDG
jgi:hypothetical protein